LRLTPISRAGVAEVWLVDPDEESVEVRTSRSKRTFRYLEEARSGIVAGFGVVPNALFSSLRG